MLKSPPPKTCCAPAMAKPATTTPALSAAFTTARDLLWGFVNRDVLTEQSLIAITWFKTGRTGPASLP
jgi:hypothetical protein